VSLRGFFDLFYFILYLLFF